MAYETVIGLEIHTELLTNSKMFCGCEVAFGGEPNTRVCEVCLGHPGTLPVPNRKAIEYTIRIGLALNCQIAGFTQFHRKNYFYPDMPKDYQISQYDLPFCHDGWLDVEVEGETRRIGILRVHLEEDTGKLVHIGESGRIHGADYSLVDFNRAGTPLAEIVSQPDIRSPEEARAFMQKLKSILEHLGVSDCNMEEGSLRCDANVSVRPEGATELGTKSEIKNMNSFRALARGLAYEVERQVKLIESGGKVIQETRHWDANNLMTLPLRSKEEAHDYRYFPDPDLIPMEPKPEWIAELKASLPELPDTRRSRFAQEYGLSEYDAGVLTSTKAMGDFFEETVSICNNAKVAANWIMGDYAGMLNENNMDIQDAAVTPKHLGELIGMIESGKISGKIAKVIFAEMFETGKLPSVLVEEKGMTQISDTDELEKIVEQVIAENPGPVAELKAGKDRTLGFLVGQVMKLTQGRANPQVVNEIIAEKIKE